MTWSMVSQPLARAATMVVSEKGLQWSPKVAEPLGLFDCCLVTDGGGAMVVVGRERAKDFPKKPVYFLGGGMAHWHRTIMQMPDVTVTAVLATLLPLLWLLRPSPSMSSSLLSPKPSLS